MKFNLTLTPDQMNSFIPITFTIPADTRDMAIFFSYEPHFCEENDFSRKLVEEKVNAYKEQLSKSSPALVGHWEKAQANPQRHLPLRNQLKFSLYDPQGQFRGRWDSPQYYGEWVNIGHFSSRGFYNQHLTAGEWTLEFETHGIFSEEVHLTLEIKLTPDTRAKKWFAGELHSHTNHSDGNHDLKTVVEHAHQANIDFMVLSDHNTISAWADIDPNFPVKVIPGLELSSFYGHVVVTGAKDYIDWRTSGSDDDYGVALQQVAQQGAIATIAHPFEPGAPLCCGCEWLYTNVDMNQITALEIWSGSWRKEHIKNTRAIQWWDELLNKGYKITGVAARDVHRIKQFTISDTANTYVRAASCQQEELIEGIRLGRVFVSSGPQLELSITTSSNQSYTIGDTVPLGDENIELHGEITNLQDATVVKIISDGQLVKELDTNDPEYSFNQSLPRPTRWIRIQIHSKKDDALLAVANPIYFTN